MRCAAIVLAAGQGKRMGSKIPKQFMELEGKPVLYYSLKCFEDCGAVSDIVVVTGEEFLEYCRKEIEEKYGFQKIRAVIAGGKERYDSVYEGLKACEGCDYVYIHDGARPFPTQEILENTLKAAKDWGACVTAVPSKDTMKLGNAEGFVERTLDRSVLWNVQTPQVFSYSLIRKAHEEMRKGEMSGITDDSMMVERLGLAKVKLVEGSYDNLKITTPEDLAVAESILEKRRSFCDGKV